MSTLGGASPDDIIAKFADLRQRGLVPAPRKPKRNLADAECFPTEPSTSNSSRVDSGSLGAKEVAPTGSLLFGSKCSFLNKYDAWQADNERSDDFPISTTSAPDLGLRTPPRKESKSMSQMPSSSYSVSTSASIGSRTRLLSGGSTSSTQPTRAPDRANVRLNTLLISAHTADRILQVVDLHYETFNTVNFITALHRLATVATNSRKGNLRKDSRFRLLTRRLHDVVVSTNLGSLKPQDLSNIAWALTRLGVVDGPFFSALAEHSAFTIQSFEPVNLSMTLWAFARSGYADRNLFLAAAAVVKQKVRDFEPQQLANTSWAMSKSGLVDKDFFEAIARLALSKLEEFEPMNCSMLLYSFALAQFPHKELFEAVGKRSSVRALSASSSMPHVVTNMALAYAEAGVHQNQIFASIAEVAGKRLQDFRPQQIASLASSFATAGVQNARLFHQIGRCLAKRSAEFRPNELEDVCQAFDKLGYSTDSLQKVGPGSKEDDPSTWRLLLFLTMTILMLLVSALLALPEGHPK